MDHPSINTSKCAIFVPRRNSGVEMVGPYLPRTPKFQEEDNIKMQLLSLCYQTYLIISHLTSISAHKTVKTDNSDINITRRKNPKKIEQKKN